MHKRKYNSVFVLFCVLMLSSKSLLGQSKEVSLFDGKTLKGWKAVKGSQQKLWSVADSMIISGDEKTLIPENTYLRTEKEYKDFEFRCLFKLTGDPATGFINSGIQYRSVLEGEKIIGYQADIGDGYWGSIYDEHRREKTLTTLELKTLSKVLRKNDWNSYIIRCKGNRHELYINGVKTADYYEMDASIPDKGVIAVQIHSGGKAKVWFRDLVITEL